jgi:hypothetical protein
MSPEQRLNYAKVRLELLEVHLEESLADDTTSRPRYID